MGGGHGHREGGTTYKGLTLYPPKKWHTYTAKGMGAIMWFWIFYRAKKDGAVALGLRHPWEGHDYEDHSHEHEHGSEASP